MGTLPIISKPLSRSTLCSSVTVFQKSLMILRVRKTIKSIQINSRSVLDLRCRNFKNRYSLLVEGRFLLYY